MNNTQKADLYNQLISEHTKLSNQISSIKGESIEISESNRKRIFELQQRQSILSKKMENLMRN
jgi:hypothetical protein